MIDWNLEHEHKYTYSNILYTRGTTINSAMLFYYSHYKDKTVWYRYVENSSCPNIAISMPLILWPFSEEQQIL